MLEYNIAHRRFVAALCMLYKIRFNPMHPLYGAELVKSLLLAVPPRCRTTRYRRTFIPLSVSLWNDLGDPVFDGVGLAGFNCFLLLFMFFYLATHLAPFLSC